MELDVLALMISLFAFLLSFVQFIRDTSREKKKDTIDAFHTLQNEAFDPLNKLLTDEHVDITTLEIGCPHWREITSALVKIEHFSAGVNANVFSIEILDRVAGAYFIRLFESLKPMILKKREQNISKGKHYPEFEETVRQLKEMRALRGE